MSSYSTIITQFGEYVIYENLVKIGISTNWEDAEIDEDTGTIKPSFEMIGRDVSGMDIPMGIYNTLEEAEQAMSDLHSWLDHKAFAVYEMPPMQYPDVQGADT